MTFPVASVVLIMQSKCTLPLLIAVGGLLGGCAGMDGFWDDLRGTPQVYTHRSIPIEEVPAFPRNCLAADPEFTEREQCLAVQGACYQLDYGNWCAGDYSPFVISYHSAGAYPGDFSK